MNNVAFLMEGNLNNHFKAETENWLHTGTQELLAVNGLEKYLYIEFNVKLVKIHCSARHIKAQVLLTTGSLKFVQSYLLLLCGSTTVLIQL